VRDELTDDTFDLRARLTINAAGGWAAPLARQAGVAGWDVPMSRAVNLVTRLAAPPCALGDTAAGQFLFQVPWRGLAMFGTLHDSHLATADDLTVRQADVERFVHLINRAFPAAHLTPDAVTLVHRGLLPAAGIGADGEVRLAKDSILRDHRADGLPGLMTVVGVRYTTARLTAERTIDAAGVALNRALGQSRTATTPLAGADIPDLGAFLGSASLPAAGLEGRQVRRLAATYGTDYTRVLAVISGRADLAAPLGSDTMVTGGEVVYAVRHEMAERLADVVQRRTELGSAACPPRAVLERTAALMATERGWDAARVAAEIAAVEDRYRVPS
jgi:glycerol-3-phosphate dehydrogenase